MTTRVCECASCLDSLCLSQSDLQMVNITLRVLSKPSVEQLPTIFKVWVLASVMQCMHREWCS